MSAARERLPRRDTRPLEARYDDPASRERRARHVERHRERKARVASLVASTLARLQGAHGADVTPGTYRGVVAHERRAVEPVRLGPPRTRRRIARGASTQHPDITRTDR